MIHYMKGSSQMFTYLTLTGLSFNVLGKITIVF